MKKKFLVLFLFLTGVGYAQPQFGSIAKFGMAAGFSPVWVMPNLGALNGKTEALGLGSFSNSGMFAWGGSGYAYVLFIKNLRMGGMGYGGSTSLSSDNAQVDFSTSGGAFTIEYTLPFVKKIDISFGLMIGGGSQTVSVYSNDGNFNWDGIWDNVGKDSTGSYQEVLENSFFTLAPTLNIDLPLNRFLMFRIGGGYIFAIGEEWTAANDKPVDGVPSDLNGNSFFIQTGIYFGFFAF